MAEPFFGEIRVFSFNFAPRGWAMCNGQTLPISQNQALFSLLGTTYGGNGQTTFGLPNLQGRVPLHVGGGISQGQAAGEAGHTLTLGELPSHTHALAGSSSGADTGTAINNLLGTTSSTFQPYGLATGLTPMSATSIPDSGGNGQQHNNMQPYLVLNFCISLGGIFPSRS